MQWACTLGSRRFVHLTGLAGGNVRTFQVRTHVWPIKGRANICVRFIESKMTELIVGKVKEMFTKVVVVGDDKAVVVEEEAIAF